MDIIVLPAKPTILVIHGQNQSEKDKYFLKIIGRALLDEVFKVFSRNIGIRLKFIIFDEPITA